MRKWLLIGLGVYLAIGLAIALVKMPGTYACPGYHGPSGYTTMDESCHLIASAGERARFIGLFIPRWPSVVMREGIGPRPHP
jgi:hypothetical protein